MNEDIQAQVTEPIQTVIQKLEGWLDSFISLIPNMAVTLLLFIIFLVLARLGSKLFIKNYYSFSNSDIGLWN